MPETPMNVIVITSDEMRGDCPSFMGNPDCKTPSLDRFAQRGVAFKQQFAVHGKCVPSRVSMVTGRYTHTEGFRTVMEENLLPAGDPNLLDRLKREGYESAVFGHNHVWENLFASNTKGAGCTDYQSFTEGYFDDLATRSREVPQPGPGAKPVREDLVGRFFDYRGRKTELSGFCDDNRADQAIRYLTEVRDKSRPFYLHVNFGAPHPPYAVEEPYFSMYDRDAIRPWPYQLPENAPDPLRWMREIRTGMEVDESAFRELQATYYGKVTKVDSLIGRVLDCVESQGLMDNSIILFWVDHGDFAGQYGLPEKWDTAMQDCILHVPQILYAPQLPSGAHVESMTEHVDVAPTILELLGLEPEPQWGIHGESLLPIIRGEKRKEYVFADGGHEKEMQDRIDLKELMAKRNRTDERDLGGKQLTYGKYPESMARTKMVRSERYKLIIRTTGDNELYDMREDPDELRNLYGRAEYNDVIRELQHAMIQWCLRTDTDRPYQPTVGA